MSIRFVGINGLLVLPRHTVSATSFWNSLGAQIEDSTFSDSWIATGSCRRSTDFEREEGLDLNGERRCHNMLTGLAIALSISAAFWAGLIIVMQRAFS